MESPIRAASQTEPMPTWQSAAHRGRQRARCLLRRAGEEFRRLRIGSGISTRQLAATLGISHTQVRRIEAGVAPHVDLDLISRMASVLGAELSLGVHPIGPPVRDKAHVELLERFAARLGPGMTWADGGPDPDPRRPSECRWRNRERRIRRCRRGRDSPSRCPSHRASPASQATRPRDDPRDPARGRHAAQPCGHRCRARPAAAVPRRDSRVPRRPRQGSGSRRRLPRHPLT